MPCCAGSSLSPSITRYVFFRVHFFECNILILTEQPLPFLNTTNTVHSRTLHKQQQYSQTEDGSLPEGMAKSDSSGESKMPTSWEAFRRAHHHHHQHSHNYQQQQQQQQQKLDKPSHSAENTAETLNAQILGDADSSSSLDKNDVDSSGVPVSPSLATVAEAELSEEGLAKTADSLLAIAAHKSTSAGEEKAKVEESVDAKLDRLIRELNEDSKREQTANQVDASFQQAEEVKAKLDFEINRTRLILMRLRSLQRNVADAHFLAKKLVESDAVSESIKEYALTNLDKSVETVKKVLVKM